MSLKRIAGVVLRQFYLLRSSPTRILPLFAWVVFDIVLWGFISRYLQSVMPPGFNFATTLLGAVLMWDFFGRVMQGVTVAFLEDVWSRNFLNFFATPLTIGEYVGGLVIVGIGTSLVGLLAMLTVAALGFGFTVLGYGLMLIPFLLILFLCGIALGIFASAVVLRLGPASEWFVWPIPAVLSPFVGVFYPLSTLPEWMQLLAYLLPPSYVFEGMRAVLGVGEFAGSTLLIGAGLALLHTVLAGVFFARVYRHAVRTGLIARYSAESLS